VFAEEKIAYKVPVVTRAIPRTASAVTSVFFAYHYDLDAVTSTMTSPRIYLEALPTDMLAVSPVQSKKDLFIRILLPLVLKANDEILAQRARLLTIQSKPMPDSAEQAWLKDMADLYACSGDDISALIERIDVIPVSLALAQGIDESGWGTSRFAIEGDSLFGQHAPKDSKRLDAAKAGSVGVAEFSGLLASVQSYFHNLNSGSAYGKLRSIRAQLKREGKTPSGIDLLPGLADYSQRGDDYLKNLSSIILANKLDIYESVSLDSKGGAMLILPE
jgi:uncharacterized FlgJ-related protein